MTKQNRTKLIQDLQNERNSKVICYITGDRPSFGVGVPSLATQIGSDAVRYFRDILQEIGTQENIDLFLYSRGGETIVSSPIVNLIRSHCNKKFGILVPYRANSAATLLCLGGDEIVMGEMGQLSPIDPTTVNVFNPGDPTNPSGRWPISVEDVTSYLSLATEKAKLVTEDSIREVFRLISEKVHPIALGNVHRIYNLIRLLAPKLLSLHMNPSDVQEQAKIKLIVDTLTEKLYTHDYIISNEEAKHIGLKISDPDKKLEELMWNLYEQYERDLKLLEPFNPAYILQEHDRVNFREECAYIETETKTFSFITEGEILKPPTLEEALALFPPQLNQPVFQMLPQLIQLRQQMHFVEPTVKIKSQKWLSIN